MAVLLRLDDALRIRLSMKVDLKTPNCLFTLVVEPGTTCDWLAGWAKARAGNAPLSLSALLTQHGHRRSCSLTVRASRSICSPPKQPDSSSLFNPFSGYKRSELSRAIVLCAQMSVNSSGLRNNATASIHKISEPVPSHVPDSLPSITRPRAR